MKKDKNIAEKTESTEEYVEEGIFTEYLTQNNTRVGFFTDHDITTSENQTQIMGQGANNQNSFSSSNDGMIITDH